MSARGQIKGLADSQRVEPINMFVMVELRDWASVQNAADQKVFAPLPLLWSMAHVRDQTHTQEITVCCTVLQSGHLTALTIQPKEETKLEPVLSWQATSCDWQREQNQVSEEMQFSGNGWNHSSRKVRVVFGHQQGAIRIPCMQAGTMQSSWQKKAKQKNSG